MFEVSAWVRLCNCSGDGTSYISGYINFLLQEWGCLFIMDLSSASSCADNYLTSEHYWIYKYFFMDKKVGIWFNYLSKNQQEWLSVWMILSGEINARERKQNKNFVCLRPHGRSENILNKYSYELYTIIN